MNRTTPFVIVFVASLGLAACAHEARADVPKPPAGGHAFDVELVETASSGARETRHFVLMVAPDGPARCAKSSAHDGRDAVVVSACLTPIPGVKPTLVVRLERSRGETSTSIEGLLPLSEGSRILVGRADHGAERVEVYVTGS